MHGTGKKKKKDRKIIKCQIPNCGVGGRGTQTEERE